MSDPRVDLNIRTYGVWKPRADEVMTIRAECCRVWDLNVGLMYRGQKCELCGEVPKPV